jgi:hypothetical protein
MSETPASIQLLTRAVKTLKSGATHHQANCALSSKLFVAINRMRGRKVIRGAMPRACHSALVADKRGVVDWSRRRSWAWETMLRTVQRRGCDIRVESDGYFGSENMGCRGVHEESGRNPIRNKTCLSKAVPHHWWIGNIDQANRKKKLENERLTELFLPQ